ncbi:hypothetical protein K431DRAFT_284027 [Polychaeton citri CBS 116435]|uniref:Poly(A) RNA polymerase mitochondrial-like central palm domain-containing protein n=1 Tax=Polychaeton citri CBS 116435 TaxID=1314669 RepID=A0A9P4QAT2_9PEZI|nr:hypothetical protein K431DRAFT_284027 [Polychaeton citri CBS 116435]
MSCRTIFQKRTCAAPNSYDAQSALQATLSSCLRSPYHNSAAQHTPIPAQTQNNTRRIGQEDVRKSQTPAEVATTPRSQSKRRSKFLQDRMAGLINTNSLSETLDAHRQWNRARDTKTQEHQQQRLQRGHKIGEDADTDLTKELLQNRPSPDYSPSPFPRGAFSLQPHASGANGFDFQAMSQSLQLLGERGSISRRSTKDGVETAAIPSDFDYRPLMVPPRPLPADIVRTEPPWKLKQDGTQAMSHEDALSEEIERFSAHLEQTSDEKAARQAVTNEAMTQIKSFLAQEAIDHEWTAEVFGSQANSLALPTSDIDIRMDALKERKRSSPIGSDNAETHALFPAERLHHFLRTKSPDFILVRARFRAVKRRIISMQHKYTGLDVQIVCNANQTYRQPPLIAKYIEELPTLPKLYRVLRTALQMRRLDDTFTGGLNGYTTLMMVVAALKRHPDVNTASVGEQLLFILKFYATFPTLTHGLAVDPPKMFKKHNASSKLALKHFIDAAHKRDDRVRAGQWTISRHHRLQPYMLILQDPANSFNDLGTNSVGWQHIQRSLGHVSHILASPASDAPMLSSLVGDCHNMFAARRQRLAEYAISLDGGSVQSNRITEVDIDTDVVVDNKIER